MEYNPRLDLFNERLDPSWVSDIAGEINDTSVKVDVRSPVNGEDGPTSLVS